MARKVQKNLMILILVLVLAAPAAVFGQVAVEQTVKLVLNTDAALQAGSYQITIIMPDGGQVDGQIEVPKAPAAAVQPEDEAESLSIGPEQASGQGPAESQPAADQQSQAGGIPGQILIPVLIAVVAVLAGAGLFVYFKIIAPKRQLEPYQKALQLLRDKEYASALPALTKIEGKLPDDLRGECRFFIAFAKQQLNKLDQSAYDLDTLLEEDPQNADVAYLLAYIYLQKDDLRKAEAVLEKMEKNRQLGHRDARRMLGIVKFRRAYEEMKEGRVDAAEDLFEKVKALGDFADQIPSDLRDRNLLMGTKALFDRNTEEARTLFNRLVSDLGDTGRKTNPGLLASAKVGLALADWLDEKEGQGIEALLVESVRLLDPEGTQRMKWLSAGSSENKDLADQLDALEEDLKVKEIEPSKIDRDYQRILRDVHFLRGMNQLREWTRLDSETAFDGMQQYYTKVLEILACARTLDAKFSDVYLVAGLLMFYLHKQGMPERSEGIDLLQEAQKLGMREPTALEIINHREKARQANKGAIDTYLQVLDKYINDPTVRKEIRIHLLEQRRRYQRVRALENRSDPGSLRTVEPTVAEVQHRTEILLARVGQILQERKSAETADLARMCSEIQQGSEALVKQAQSIESTEAMLLEKTGNELFRD